MKGPYERLKYDLRRLWECPVCQHKLRLPGDRTSALCQCQQANPPEEQVWMRLVDDCERPLRRLALAGAFPPAVAADHFLAVTGELPVDQERGEDSLERGAIDSALEQASEPVSPPPVIPPPEPPAEDESPSA